MSNPKTVKISFPNCFVWFERSLLNILVCLRQLWKALLNVIADFDSLPLHLCQNLLWAAAIHRMPLDNVIGGS